MNLCTEMISIHVGTPDDAVAVAKLAMLDCSPVPAAPLLLAEREGQLQAALSLWDGATIADPFAPSAELVALLRVRAERLAPEVNLSSRWRSAIAFLRAHRAFAA